MEKRHELILDYLKEYEEVGSAELAESLGVSIETIRRDLNKLADQNKLYRTHGGAMSLQNQNIGQSFSTRKKSHNDGKKHIAELIREHIFEDAVIVLDASSTAWYIAQRLPNIPCKIITSSMRIIHSLAHKPHIETIATGGVYS
ncbi:MAG: DeoR/GlpR family DNA-binding transcription regulator, partial [Haemophilus parahaemolyticus]|nr:DeoR/GlpR family DNA-binding transcription regulator [Haemophilus parahaemolyticus]